MPEPSRLAGCGSKVVDGAGDDLPSLRCCEKVALSLRDRLAERAKDVDWRPWVNCTDGVERPFGFPVAERQGYIARQGSVARHETRHAILALAVAGV